jgi:iron complex outermembrane receptor protein
MSKKLRNSGAGLVSLMGFVCLGAQAQLEEVVVTAEKRVASLQETPIAITAYDSENISAMRIDTVRDVGTLTPSVQTPTYPTTSNNLAFFIRGLGNTDSIILTKDNTVGIYYDGVFSGRHTGVLSDLVDLERVEVLRGPQGTLYGRNTTAGAINLVTRKPTGEFGFDQVFEVGNYGHLRSRSRLDLPDVAGFKASLTLALAERDGWVENGGEGQVPNGIYEDFYLEDKQGVRFALRYDGIDRLLVDYAYDYSDMDTTSPYFQYSGPAGPGLAITGGPIVASYPDRLEKTFDAATGARRSYYLPLTTTEAEGHSLTVSYDLSDNLVLKSITGYRAFDDDLSQNFARSFGGASPFDVNLVTDYEQFTQELQLVGGTDTVEFVGGLYYLQEEGTAVERQYLDRQLFDGTGIIAFDSNGPCVSGAFGAPPPVCNVLDPLFFPVFLGEFTVDSDVDSWAAFGQATWTPTALDQRLDLTLGARYTRDERSATRVTDGLLWNPVNAGQNTIDIDQPDWSATANYRWRDDVSTYLRVATGFRSGGASPKAPDFAQTFQEETLVSYELGVKAELAQRRLRVNAALYQTEVDDIILDYLPDPVNAPSLVEIFNSGTAEIRGLEVEMLALLGEGLRLGLNYNWLDYDIENALFPDGSDRTDTTVLAWAPEHAYSLTLDYRRPIASLGELTLHADWVWQDDQFALANTDAGEVVVESFGQLNARLALESVSFAGGEWVFGLWGRNLTDADDVNYRIGQTSTAHLAPRMYGLEMRFSF